MTTPPDGSREHPYVSLDQITLHTGDSVHNVPVWVNSSQLVSLITPDAIEGYFRPLDESQVDKIQASMKTPSAGWKPGGSIDIWRTEAGIHSIAHGMRVAIAAQRANNLNAVCVKLWGCGVTVKSNEEKCFMPVERPLHVFTTFLTDPDGDGDYVRPVAYFEDHILVGLRFAQESPEWLIITSIEDGDARLRRLRELCGAKNTGNQVGRRVWRKDMRALLNRTKNPEGILSLTFQCESPNQLGPIAAVAMDPSKEEHLKVLCSNAREARPRNPVYARVYTCVSCRRRVVDNQERCKASIECAARSAHAGKQSWATLVSGVCRLRGSRISLPSFARRPMPMVELLGHGGRSSS